jgi:hypothetical protein
MNDYRDNYFSPTSYESATETSYPSAQHTGNPPIEIGSERYNSELDRITEQEMVPDIVERLTTRYYISYNVGRSDISSTGNNHSRKSYSIRSGNRSRIIKLLSNVIAMIPRITVEDVNTIKSAVIYIKKGDTSVDFPTVVRAYLASAMIDMTPNTDTYPGSGGLSYNKTRSTNKTNFFYTPTIPFKQDDELIIYYYG